jgi:Uma2 family endonuclease
VADSKTELDLDQLLREDAIKLEITGGIPTWEASPSLRHQATVYKIQTSIRPLPDSVAECECAHYSDVLIRFKDGSLKRPDIAIFCNALPLQDEAPTIAPDAVIEVISPGYEFKDTTLNPQFYLAQDVPDVVVVDPRSGVVTHHRTTGVTVHHAPVTVELQCGCQCSIPGVETSG